MPQQQDRLLYLIVIGMAAVLAAAVVLLVLERRDGPQPLQITPGEPASTGEGGAIEVYITGAVANPGVYEMREGDRVVDLLAKAGGHAPEADLEAVNLALRLHDEDQVLVPRQGEPAPAAVQAAAGGGSSDVRGLTGPLNINAASREELDELLPGIGEAYSQRIVDSRAADGPFQAIDDLLTRRLIPQSTFDKIRELITVGP